MSLSFLDNLDYFESFPPQYASDALSLRAREERPDTVTAVRMVGLRDILNLIGAPQKFGQRSWIIRCLSNHHPELDIHKILKFNFGDII